MRAVTKRKVWVEGEDREHNVKFSCYSERASHLPYYNESFGSNSYYKYSKQHKKKKQFHSTQVWKGLNSDVATRYYHSR